MPFLTRLGAAAARVLGLFSRTGPTVFPTITSTSSSSQSVISINWTNTSNVFPIYIYLNNNYYTQVSAGSTSAGFGGVSCGTTYSIKLAYASGGSIGPFSNSVNQYVTPIGSGNYAGQFCNGCTLNYNYFDGSCGYYSSPVQYNSPSCGCTPPLQSFCRATGYDYLYCGCNADVLVGGYNNYTYQNYTGAATMCCQSSADTSTVSQPSTWTVYGGTCQNADLELSIWRSPSQQAGSWYIGTVNCCSYFCYGGYQAYVS